MHRVKQKLGRASDFRDRCGEPDDAPRFRLLSDEKLRRIHEASLEVLEDVGVKITTEAALRLLVDGGCTITDENVVRIPRRVVEEAIESAPKRVVVYNREGAEALFLEGRNTHFGLGITGIHFRDLESGERRDATLEDVGLACRVADALPNLDLIATPLVVKATQEMPRKVVKQSEFEAMLSNTTKPLMLLVDYVPILHDVLEMAAAVAGGAEALRERPFVLPYFNSVSPLIYNTDTLDNLLL
ncbi:MAG: trimethylamine methyltransferase family protein, partial [Dehalococcoidia bacterium]